MQTLHMGLLKRIRRRGDKADGDAPNAEPPVPPAPPTPVPAPPPEPHPDEPLVVLPPVRPPLEDDPFDGLVAPPRRMAGSTSAPCSPLRYCVVVSATFLYRSPCDGIHVYL